MSTDRTLVPSVSLLFDAEVLLDGAYSSRDPQSVAFWAGYRLGVLDAIAAETFDGLLDCELDGLLDIAKRGYIAGRAGMTTTEVLDQFDRERHEAAARITGFGVGARSCGNRPGRIIGS